MPCGNRDEGPETGTRLVLTSTRRSGTRLWKPGPEIGTRLVLTLLAAVLRSFRKFIRAVGVANGGGTTNAAQIGLLLVTTPEYARAGVFSFGCAPFAPRRRTTAEDLTGGLEKARASSREAMPQRVKCGDKSNLPTEGDRDHDDYRGLRSLVCCRRRYGALHVLPRYTRSD